MAFLVGVCLMVLGTMVRADNLKELAKIEAEYKNMSSLRSRVVHENVLSKLKKNAEDAQSDAARVAEIAGQSSKRPLLFKEVFPEPKESQTLFYEYFAENYCRAIDGFVQQLNGGDRPSTTEIDRLLQDHRERSGGVSGTGSLGGGRYSPSMSDRSSPETLEDKLISGLYLSRAKKVSCYVNPDAFCCYDYWKSHPDGPRDTMLLDSWFTQLAAWIQEDVVLSINQLNRVEASVLENPVKRLIEVSFGGAEAGTMMTGGATVTSRSSESAGKPSGLPFPAGVPGIGNPSRLGSGFQYDGYGGGNAAARHDANSGSRLPGYVMFQKSVGMGVPGVPGMPMTTTMPGSVGTASGSEGSLTGTMTTPLTDRSSNDLIDVVHFEVAVIIDSTRINDFTNALQDIKYSADDPESSKRNQITILKLQIDPVDMEAEKTLGYRYGVASLSVLRLVCEYVFFKAGYEAYKPEPVKKLLLQETSDSRTGLGYPGFGGGLSPQR